MKGRLAALVGVLCVACLVVAVADAKGKPPKPDKPDEPDSKAECIKFTEDLESAGETIISGCCPNAGPWPRYDMTLDTGSQLDGTHEGYLFINSLGTGPTQQYIVQFWTWDVDTETPGTGDYFFEIRGGTIVRDRKAKLLTVTYVDEAAVGWIYHDVSPTIQVDIPAVSFELIRTSDHSYCTD